MSAPSRISKLFKSEGFRVLVGTTVGLTICAIPVFGKGIISGEGKKGHDLFSQEKPESVEARSDKWARDARDRREEKAGKANSN
jgi:hypothetical protein